VPGAPPLGASILFVGDSVGRYQYMSLLSFLVEGACPTQPRN
jgi:hypothetical protein